MGPTSTIIPAVSDIWPSPSLSHHPGSGHRRWRKVEVWAVAEQEPTDVGYDNAEDQWVQEVGGEQEIWHGHDLVATSFTAETWFYMMHSLYCILFDGCLSLLYTESKLSVWMLVTICGATVIVILICILVLILYRRRNVQLNCFCSFISNHTGLLVWH